MTLYSSLAPGLAETSPCRHQSRLRDDPLWNLLPRSVERRQTADHDRSWQTPRGGAPPARRRRRAAGRAGRAPSRPPSCPPRAPRGRRRRAPPGRRRHGRRRAAPPRGATCEPSTTHCRARGHGDVETATTRAELRRPLGVRRETIGQRLEHLRGDGFALPRAQRCLARRRGPEAALGAARGRAAEGGRQGVLAVDLGAGSRASARPSRCREIFSLPLVKSFIGLASPAHHRA
jgi:hypothetical protein